MVGGHPSTRHPHLRHLRSLRVPPSLRAYTYSDTLFKSLQWLFVRDVADLQSLGLVGRMSALLVAPNGMEGGEA